MFGKLQTWTPQIAWFKDFIFRVSKQPLWWTHFETNTDVSGVSPKTMFRIQILKIGGLGKGYPMGISWWKSPESNWDVFWKLWYPAFSCHTLAWEGQAFVKSRWKRAMSTTMNHDVLMGFYSSIFLGGTIRNPTKRNQRKRHLKKEKKPHKNMSTALKNIHKPS